MVSTVSAFPTTRRQSAIVPRGLQSKFTDRSGYTADLERRIASSDDVRLFDVLSASS